MLCARTDKQPESSNVAAMTAPVEPDDNYTGHVEPHTAARRTLPGATIVKTSVGPMDNNAYLVTCSATGETLLIDAANDAEVLIDLVQRYAPKVSLIVTSHQHFDHWQALEAVAGATGAPTASHEIDAEPLPVKPDRLLANGDQVQIGELTFDVIHLRGHTPGSVALALGGPATGGVTQLFTGDCLFPGGPGRTTRPEDFQSLISDLEERVFTVYGDETVIYPGHGDDTVLGTERPHLDEWRERGW
jgi:glyoxylase-like metal-dependent hydrolase (beta-lactamase superfamily II)